MRFRSNARPKFQDLIKEEYNGHWNLRGFLAKKSARPVKAGRKPPGARLNQWFFGGRD
jgi:hypothetical protein